MQYALAVANLREMALMVHLLQIHDNKWCEMYTWN